MSFPKIDGETDRIVVVGGFTEELETTVLRNCMVYFGRVVNLYRFNTIALVEYNAILPIKKLETYLATRDMKAGGKILSIEKYNSLEEFSDSTKITEKRKFLQKELDKWKFGITDGNNNEDVIEIPKDLNPILISSSDDEEQIDETKEESETETIEELPKKRSRAELISSLPPKPKKIAIGKVKPKTTKIQREGTYANYSLIHALSSNANSNDSKIKKGDLKTWPSPNQEYPPIRDQINDELDYEPKISSMIDKMEYNISSEKPKDDTRTFTNATKQMIIDTLSLVTSTNSSETFRNVSIDSPAVNITSAIVSEKMEELIKTTLQLTQMNTRNKTAVSGTWQTVAAAASLLDTPSKILHRSKYRIIGSEDKKLDNASFSHYPWRKEVLDAFKNINNIPSPIEQQLISDDEISESDESSEDSMMEDSQFGNNIPLSKIAIPSIQSDSSDSENSDEYNYSSEDIL